jgi:hypothetical protein
MRNHDASVGLDGVVYLAVLTLAIGLGWASVVLASEPATPTMQGENSSSPDANSVQERGLLRQPFGSMTISPVVMEPKEFSCDHKTKTCTCRKSTVGDCDLMKGQVCKGETYKCPASSQSCTCEALK